MPIIAPLTAAVVEALVQLQTLTGNLGLSILLFTFIIRSLLLPLSIPSLKSQKKIKEMQPELNKLKKKHGADKQALQTAQLELYKKYNVNPLAGCLPQIVQLALLILLYSALRTFLDQPTVNGVSVNTQFFFWDLKQADPFFILPVLAGLTQLILSIMILPGGEVRDIVPNDSKNKKVQKENEQEEDMAEMAASMQKQMLFMVPAMTIAFGFKFPSGLVLYWVATTVFSIVQQYFISGPGGLVEYSQNAISFIKNIGKRGSKA